MTAVCLLPSCISNLGPDNQFTFGVCRSVARQGGGSPEGVAQQEEGLEVVQAAAEGLAKLLMHHNLDTGDSSLEACQVTKVLRPSWQLL